MALDYFIIDETPTQKTYIEANSGELVTLVRFSVFNAWAEPQFIADWEGTTIQVKKKPSEWQYAVAPAVTVALSLWGSKTSGSTGVKSWRDTDRRNWFETVVEPYTTSILNNIRGYGFPEEEMIDYPDAPPITKTAISKLSAFKRYGFIFIPGSAVDPRSEEVVNPEDDDDDFGDGDGDGDGDDGNYLVTTDEPSLLSTVSKWALILGAGAATAYITYKATSRFF